MAKGRVALETKDDCQFDYIKSKKKVASNDLRSSSNVVYPKKSFFLASVTNMIERYRRKNDLLNEPTFIICNAKSTMGVLCSLTVERDKVDQRSLKRIVSYY